MHRRMLAVTAALILVATSNVAAQSGQSPSAQSKAKEATSAPAPQAKAVERLQQASHRLREAVRGLQTMPPGPERDTAVKAAREALQDTEQAMAQLPPEWKVAGGSTQAPTAVGATGVPRSPETAMRRLQTAADALYDAIHAMAKLEPGPSRNAAINKANEALLETEQAATLSELQYRRRTS